MQTAVFQVGVLGIVISPYLITMQTNEADIRLLNNCTVFELIIAAIRLLNPCSVRANEAATRLLNPCTVFERTKQLYGCLTPVPCSS